MHDHQILLKEFKVLILDADGVFFTGSEDRAVLSDGSVVVIKQRSLIDGQGISFLRALGIRIVFASGEGEPLNSIVEKLNALPSVQSGEWAPISLFARQNKKQAKVESIEQWLNVNGYTWNDCAYIGDDRSDFEAMSLAALKVAPANARRLILRIADIMLHNPGGDGAIREFAELVLDARNVDETTLPIA